MYVCACVCAPGRAWACLGVGVGVGGCSCMFASLKNNLLKLWRTLKKYVYLQHENTTTADHNIGRTNYLITQTKFSTF